MGHNHRLHCLSQDGLTCPGGPKVQWLRLSNGVLLIRQQVGPCSTETPKAQALSLLLPSCPRGSCCRLGPHARCPTGQKRGERKAAFSRALMPTQCTWVGRGYTDTRGRKGGQEMRSDHVPREERGDLDGPVQSLPRALRGLFGRSNELLHTKPLTLGAVITVCPH